MLNCVSVLKMTKLQLKGIAVFLTLIACAFGVMVYNNPGQLFRLDLQRYQLVSMVPSASEHIRGYGVDVQEVEQAYILLRKFLAVSNINRIVYVYRANPVSSDGAIGTLPVRYVGVYKQDAITGRDVIIYNGMSSVLYHELTHFFFEHTSKVQNSEICAQLVVQDLTWATKYSLLRQQALKVLELYLSKELS